MVQLTKCPHCLNVYLWCMMIKQTNLLGIHPGLLEKLVVRSFWGNGEVDWISGAVGEVNDSEIFLFSSHPVRVKSVFAIIEKHLNNAKRSLA